MEISDTTCVTSLWRPYHDVPLFGPGLLRGLEETEDTERLLSYLRALVDRRGTVHTFVAFNAVYFGYDLEFGGYVGGPIDFDAFPRLSADSLAEPLPVGAMVAIRTGDRALYTEVVHREDDGTPRPGTEEEVRTERVVFDADAFSAGTVVSEAQLARMRSHGRWLDRLGHFEHHVHGARSPQDRQTECEDFVDYLLGPGRAQLMAGPLPLLLRDGAGRQEMSAALHAVLATIDRALSAVSSLRRWRGYAFTRDGFARRLAEDGPLGGPDLELLVRNVARPVAGRGRRLVGRDTEVGTFLRSLSGGEHGLAGTGYVHALVHANTLIDDHVNEHGERGVLPNGMRVHLADPHRRGGLWVTRPAGGTEAHGAQAASEPPDRVPGSRAPWELLVEYDVAPFLRRLPEGQRAGDGARVEYHRLLSRFGLRGDLPAGFTLVRGHSRTRGGSTTT